MKGNFFGGLLLIIIGLIFFANYNLGLDIPVFSTIFALGFIFLGIHVIVNGLGIKNKSEMIFHEGEIKASELQDKYSMIFSNGCVDLRDLPFPEKYQKIKIDTVFAKGTIRINPDTPMVIKLNSAFAGARMPNNTVISFGSYTYNTKGYKEGSPYILIETDVVFGQLDVVES